MTGWLELDLRPLAWALIHFLWQGSLVAMLLAATLRVMPRADARVRYAISCLAMVAMASLPLLTALRLAPAAPSPQVTAVPPQTPVDAAMGWIVLVWSLGVVLVGVRHVRAWIGLQRWVDRQTTTVTGSVRERFEQLADSMGIDRPVRLLASLQAEVPSTLGCLRPVVLVPASLLTGLPAAQLDALLAHELAHVRRWDYAINLLQIFVETVLFYHPAVWWVSRQIRIERESCCDDVAVALCQDRRAYVEALTTLETMRGTNMAMSANGGSLLTRVRRLLDDRGPNASTGSIGAMLAAVLLLAGLTVAVNACDSPTQSDADKAHDVSAAANVAKDDPMTLHFVGEDGQVVELQRPEGMTDAEFKQHIHEHWTSIESEHGKLAGENTSWVSDEAHGNVEFGKLPDENTFVVDGEAHSRFVNELVQRGLAQKGDEIKIEFSDGVMTVNGQTVDPKDLTELKEIMHGADDGEPATFELKAGGD